jgi:lipopolysaccharide/colanic/teichoic acid biosynthesis glycosyltransferase
MLKTLFERMIAAAGLIVFSPILAAAAAAVAVEDGQPVLFRQTRVGKSGRPFELLKFRSMHTGTPGASITSARDSRITRVGRVLRRYKIDELPQLWNVVRGDMSLIGPRPEVPEFVDMTDPVWREILTVRPGISDLASLVYRDEEKLLSTAVDTGRFYRETVLPAKLALSLHYLRIRSLWTDARLLVLTLRYSFFPSGFDPDLVQKQFSCEERVAFHAVSPKRNS